MHLRDFMSFCSQNLGHTKKKCSNSSMMTSRFGLMYPRLAGSCCGRKYREKKYNLNAFIDAFIDVFSYNEELFNGTNASGMSGKFALQNGVLISSCLLTNLLRMNGLWIASTDGHALAPNVWLQNS